MHECSALLEFLLCNHAGFKIVPGSFCEDSVILDLVLHLMHSQFWLHHSTRSGSFCRGLELFCSSVEASFFGLVVIPRIVLVEGAGAGAVRAAVTLSSIVGCGCFFAAVNGVGLFLCSSRGVGLFCSGFSVGTPTILCQAIRLSCQSYTLHILASRREKRWSCV